MCIDDEAKKTGKPLGCEHPKSDKYTYPMLRRVFPTCQVEALAVHLSILMRENEILTNRVIKLERKLGITPLEDYE